jgi:hypothetical protein
LVLTTIGCSSLYWFLYLIIPIAVALRLSSTDRERYLGEDAHAIMHTLGWIASAYAYLWLLTDEVPGARAETRAVQMQIETSGAPAPSSALARLVYSVPALILLALLSMVATCLWVIGAITILFSGRVPSFVTDFIELKLRYQFRLVAYHFSLVDRYPTISDPPLHIVHHAA